MADFPHATIVTADDDIYYRPDWLSNLIAISRVHPNAIVASRAHLTCCKNDGTLAPYSEWDFDTEECVDRSHERMIFPTGSGGILYPPSSLDPRVSDCDTFMRLCPNADDIWFFWMAVLAGTARRRIVRHEALVEWTGSQAAALFHDNWLGGQRFTGQGHGGLLWKAADHCRLATSGTKPQSRVTPISFLVPTFNRAAFIGEALAAICDQLGDDDELS